MDNIPSSDFMTKFSSDLSPMLRFSLAEQFASQPSVSLVEQLQTTLEIDELLEIFSIEAAKYVRFCGLTLNFANQAFSVSGSLTTKQMVTFNITVKSEVVAQLSYHLIDTLSKQAVRQLEQLHQQLGYPLRNAIRFFEVQRLALKDSLTGLGNRGHFDESLLQAMLHAKRKRETFALIVLDLDNFKQANDNFGHHAGDQVIREFASILLKSIRGDDHAFRLGGDEFAIIADSTLENEVHSIAARVQHNVSINAVMQQHGVSTSIGFSFFQQIDSVSSLYSRTDSALYAAKEFGRNCTKTA